MTVEEVMKELAELGDEKMRQFHAGRGAEGHLFGVKMGDLRTLAKKIKVNPELASALWQTGCVEARLLSVLLMKPKSLSADELEQMVCSVTYYQLADWLTSYVVKLHPEKEALRQKWMTADDVMAARAGWSLTTERVVKSPDGLDLSGLLDRIEAEMGAAPEQSKWTMNFCLAEIGINFPEHRARAIAIGEKIGAFRDFPTSKGCTSPYAPIWINEIVGRKG